MKWADDIETGKIRRTNIIHAILEEASKKGKGYIRAIGPGFIDKDLTVKQKIEINKPINRTIRDSSNSLGLTWQFKNEITRVSILVEIRASGNGYLKALSDQDSIDEVYEFFKHRYFLVAKLDENNKPYLFSNLLPIYKIPKSKFYFDSSKGNKNRVNIRDFNKYFPMYKLGMKKKGFFMPSLDLIDQLDLILSEPK